MPRRQYRMYVKHSSSFLRGLPVGGQNAVGYGQTDRVCCIQRRKTIVLAQAPSLEQSLPANQGMSKSGTAHEVPEQNSRYSMVQAPYDAMVGTFSSHTALTSTASSSRDCASLPFPGNFMSNTWGCGIDSGV